MMSGRNVTRESEARPIRQNLWSVARVVIGSDWKSVMWKHPIVQIYHTPPFRCCLWSSSKTPRCDRGNRWGRTSKTTQFQYGCVAQWLERYLHMVCVGSSILSSSTSLIPIGVVGKRVSSTWRRSLVQVQHRKPLYIGIDVLYNCLCHLIALWHLDWIWFVGVVSHPFGMPEVAWYDCMTGNRFTISRTQRTRLWRKCRVAAQGLAESEYGGWRVADQVRRFWFQDGVFIHR